MLENKFKRLCQNYSKDEKLIAKLWREIHQEYSSQERHYHTLTHLEHMYTELEAIKMTPLFAFAIFYHDIVYDAENNDNEVASAFLAKARLRELMLPKKFYEQVCQLILETQSHQASSQDNALFLDADLSILGSPYALYKIYTLKVRKEYAVYDDLTYFKGRKKVLKAFLEKKKIYQTEHFYEKYEKQGRDNMLIEYNSIIKDLQYLDKK
ncbi:MAG: Unknown protein [uncultured Sulfurovum sp.]|uniref:Metal-dependent HD superfamily phosphohydrolase n=1 Tax=uncultured Sulfurovum sp. TaxID=269237 RepID=A0A6S6SHX4_9BACT|nr:MAG: Unknown protein [uncultured Sulfurovum sp.]